VTTVDADAAWLTPEPVVERVPLDESSWVDVVRGLVPEANAVHDELVATVPWTQGRVFRYERWINEPRLSASQSGTDRHPALAEVQAWISRRYRVQFASVALAHYRDERDSVAFHRDRELRWLDATVIGVLTLGARRPWLMKPLIGAASPDAHRDVASHHVAPMSGSPLRGEEAPSCWSSLRSLPGRRTGTEDDLLGAIDLAPGSGDLLVMGGRCQVAWLHAVPKVRHRLGSRVSAQWRWTSRRGRRDPNPSYFAPRHFTSRG
jgi:alkylated DNA repair dioxygenase AlkB